METGNQEDPVDNNNDVETDSLKRVPRPKNKCVCSAGYHIFISTLVLYSSLASTYLLLSQNTLGSTDASGNTSSKPVSTISFPTQIPSLFPSNNPTMNPTSHPSIFPSLHPTPDPSEYPTSNPSTYPSSEPSTQPTLDPSVYPSSNPSSNPSTPPSRYPSETPSLTPTINPTGMPSTYPSSNPSTYPPSQPSTQPTVGPSENSNTTTNPSTSPNVIHTTSGLSTLTTIEDLTASVGQLSRMLILQQFNFEQRIRSQGKCSIFFCVLCMVLFLSISYKSCDGLLLYKQQR